MIFLFFFITLELIDFSNIHKFSLNLEENYFYFMNLSREVPIKTLKDIHEWKRMVEMQGTKTSNEFKQITPYP